jgi:hypothetical protein
VPPVELDDRRSYPSAQAAYEGKPRELALPDQLVYVELAFEDSLKHAKAVLGRHRVETETTPRFG